MREHSPAAEHGAVEVGGDIIPPGFGVSFPDRPNPFETARIIEEQVYPPEFFQGLVNHFLNLSPVRYIDPYDEACAGLFFNHPKRFLQT
jgi:hypothetical protein